MTVAAARAIHRYEYSDELRVVTRSVLCYRAEAPDGWKGPWRHTMRDAKRDARDHNRPQATPRT